MRQSVAWGVWGCWLLAVLLWTVGCGRERSEGGDGRMATEAPGGLAEGEAGKVPEGGVRVVGLSPAEGGVDGYVGSGRCRDCHPTEHARWHASYHRTMTQLPGTNSVVADFDGVVLETGGERFTLSREGGEHWVAIEDLDAVRAAPAGRKPEPVRVKVGLVTGSHHMQVFWLPAGFGNAQIGFPFTWLVGEGRWAPRHDVFIRDPNSEPPVETWNMTCIRCHSTAGQPRPRREENRFDTRVGELGISCEACHGPGAEHVTRMQEHAKARESDPTAALPADSGVVHPGLLDPVRSAQVCGQCHGMKWFDAAEDWVERGFRYRPGDDLERTTPIIRPARIAEQDWLHGVLRRAPGLFEAFFWSDGMIRVAGREHNGLLETGCHQRGGMTCLTCHSMHEYADRSDQLRLGAEGNGTCVACHDAGRYGPGHSRHAAGSSGDQCVNCHMPHTSYALLKAVRQHQIDSPRVAATLGTGRPNACNLCHQDRSLAWVAAWLEGWYGQERVVVPADRAGVSDVVWMLLAGDAGQRALAAWHLGWEPARALTGEDWQVPLLARLLADPYSAVRHIADGSLRKFPGQAGRGYDFAGPAEGRLEAVELALGRWGGATRERDEAVKRGLLLRVDGSSDEAAIEAWVRRRDDRPVHLRE